jgi:Flp pilus assembly protein TadD
LKQVSAAVAELAQAGELEPGRARYSYVYAVALYSSGRSDDALRVLKEALQRNPADRDILMALTSFRREAGD